MQLLKSIVGAFSLLALAVAVGAPAAGGDHPVPHHDVRFHSQGVTLRGTLFIPEHMPVIAAAVWVDGAGKKARNSSLAQWFAKHGIALLTYNKRGVGGSGGVYVGPEVGTNNVSRENLALLAHDAAAALRVLRTKWRLNGVPRGFIGGSQAGWIVPPAAGEEREARFMVLWSGAVETTHEDLLFEQVALADSDFWNHHSHAQVKEMMSGVADNLAWANFDPRVALSNLSIPGLWMFGGRDRNVNVDVSIARLTELISAGHPDYSYRLFPEYNHSLNGDGEDVFDLSVAWINQQVGRTR